MPHKLRTRLKEHQFYCVQCRRRCNGDNICVVQLKNGTPALKATCDKCDDCTLYKFIKNKDVQRLTKKYGKC